jgi:glycosyltransferase involved in cell wall biosynthesis
VHSPGAPARSVSVVTPVYNAARWVEQSVRSALAQRETLEVLLVDDGSTDDSAGVCRRLAVADGRVRLLRHADGRNHGPAAARNVALRAARAPYIAFLDADDWYLPGRFTASVAILESRPDVEGVWEAVRVEFEDERARAEWAREPHAATMVTLPPSVAPEDVLGALIDGAGTFCTIGVVVRRRVFDDVGLFDEELRVGSDTAMWWKMASRHRFVSGASPSPLAVYRRRSGSVASVSTPAYRESSVRLAMLVWRWAAGRGLDRATRDRFAMALIERIVSVPPGFRGWRGEMARASRITGALVASPRLVLYPRLWGRVLAARLRRNAGR